MTQRNGLFNFAVFLPILFFTFLLSGCVGLNNSFVSKNKVVLADQNPSQHFEQEVMIVRISQVLLVGKMSNEERASLHFERGVLYDSLGLWALARYDFTQALALQPKMAAVYNYLGLYLLLDEDYDGALEAFNTVFSLDPDYEYTFLNRALDFYYVGRYNLAEQDFLAFYQRNKSDPYRVLWLYLNELKFKPAEAQKNLAQRAVGLSQDYWGTYIVQYYLGKLSVQDLQAKAQQFATKTATQYAEVLTETYFYLAKQKLNMGQIDEAETLFKLAVANQVYNFVEYRFAVFELSKLGQQTQAE
ncbi:lipoprotein NlpI [Aggregatibacter segnis]|jgi:lipoprotein nlpI homolog|uniref:Lipoprotein NlpI n=1 Tax=Aggregatibacter segnis ATCC 33393 TaxID=888057 RepID=E6KZA0_9PAST|nr:lipoprotein NlpI [Aggregatibacter segnis]EFU67095.1 lipoprotein NlpI [Aggregatibacter segnis ATCC 33393]QQB08880.1 lipoprotein NlpI [Aggregatibacter segnis]SQH65368.1 Lipoprotein NlpI homolog precursor [Aggregatibacter segnis ATCC 33393]